MTKISLPYFGELDSSALEDYYDTSLDFNGVQISMDLNFENSVIDPKKLLSVKNFIENLESYDIKNKEYINNDYDDAEGDTVKFYLEHHLDEVDDKTLLTLIDFEDRSVDPEDQLLKKLHLVRVGFYPDSDDHFATFDYSIGEEITNYLVVIFTKEDGSLDYMTLES